MSLQLRAIDRIFDRLTTTWGRAFYAQYEGLEVGAVKSSWAHELDGFSGQLESIAWALENLPEHPMNVIGFRNLCRRAPAPMLPRLPEPAADPERLAAEFAKLAPVRAVIAEAVGAHDPKAWAKRHLARHAAGERVPSITLRFAREALGAASEPVQ